jgi:hypothetical protein
MIIVDSDGNFEVEPGTLKPIVSTNPVYGARMALGLPQGEWLYAPADVGHTLSNYKRVKATPAKTEEFQKAVKLYLAPYGDDVISRYLTRGNIILDLNITKAKG